MNKLFALLRSQCFGELWEYESGYAQAKREPKGSIHRKNTARHIRFLRNWSKQAAHQEDWT